MGRGHLPTGFYFSLLPPPSVEICALGTGELVGAASQVFAGDIISLGLARVEFLMMKKTKMIKPSLLATFRACMTSWLCH